MSINQYDRDAIISALLSSLGTVYDCKRTWSAWGQGTMGPEDFVPFDMQDDRIEEVVDAVIATLPSQRASDVVLQRLSERIDNIVSLAKVRFPGVATLEAAWEALVSDRNRLETQLAQRATKCDGNHGGPRCADPECWNDSPDPSIDVRTILLDIVPGDGSGLEVFAKSVDDVVAKLTELAEREESLSTQVELLTATAQAKKDGAA